MGALAEVANIKGSPYPSQGSHRLSLDKGELSRTSETKMG